MGGFGICMAEGPAVGNFHWNQGHLHETRKCMADFGYFDVGCLVWCLYVFVACLPMFAHVCPQEMERLPPRD